LSDQLVQLVLRALVKLDRLVLREQAEQQEQLVLREQVELREQLGQLVQREQQEHQ
jgi:hypothetical protein